MSPKVAQVAPAESVGRALRVAQGPPAAQVLEPAAAWVQAAAAAAAAAAPEAQAQARVVVWVQAAEAPVQLATLPPVALRLRGAEVPPRVAEVQAPGTTAVVAAACPVSCRSAALRGGWQWAQGSS
jgi:hypothetical protein